MKNMLNNEIGYITGGLGPCICQVKNHYDRKQPSLWIWKELNHEFLLEVRSHCFLNCCEPPMEELGYKWQEWIVKCTRG